MKILRFWKPILWLIIILVLSLIPGRNLPKVPVFPHFDKVVHAAMYFGLAILLVRPLIAAKIRQPYLISFLTCMIIGLLIELSQTYLTAMRSGSWLDEMANITGAALGILFFHYLMKGFWWERLV